MAWHGPPSRRVGDERPAQKVERLVGRRLPPRKPGRPRKRRPQKPYGVPRYRCEDVKANVIRVLERRPDGPTTRPAE